MKVQSSLRARLCGVAFLMALAAGCGGGSGGGEPGPGAPAAPPVGPPIDPPAVPEVRGWSQPFGSASVVIGQSGFDQLDPEGGSATPIYNPLGRAAVTLDNRLLVPGGGDSIQVFGNYEAGNGPVADAELQIRDAGTIYDLSISGAKLVASGLFTVSIHNTVPTGGILDPDAFAGGAGGGCSASNLEQYTAAALTPDGRRLIVADTNNHRVLIWNDVDRAAGPLGEANVVLGQQDMDHCAPNDHNGDGNSEAQPNGQTLSRPTSVWSNGTRLLVADADNNRVLIWNNIDQAFNFQPADDVIGQEDFFGSLPNAGQPSPSGKSLFFPTSVDVSAAGEMAVVDGANSRVLIWREIPTQGESAAFVVGRPNFTSLESLPLSAKSLSNPNGARFHGRNLIVSDTGNNRVMVWRESD